jgi:hypothetical protein
MIPSARETEDWTEIDKWIWTVGMLLAAGLYWIGTCVRRGRS